MAISVISHLCGGRFAAPRAETFRISGRPCHAVHRRGRQDDPRFAREEPALKEFTATYRQAFLEDAKTLNIEIPERTPNATDYIPSMIELIKKLIDKKSGLRLRGWLGLFPHRLVSEIWLSLPSRPAKPDLGCAGQSGRVREGRRRRLRPLEKMGNGGWRCWLGFALGKRPPRLAYRMFRVEHGTSRA